MSRPAGLSLRVQDAGAGGICAYVLAALPHWFGFPDSAAEIVVMGVLPEFHRAGIGRALLEQAEPWLGHATSRISRS